MNVSLNEIKKVAKFLVEVEYDYALEEYRYQNAAVILMEMFTLPRGIKVDKNFNVTRDGRSLVILSATVNPAWNTYYNNIITDVPYTKCVDCGRVMFNTKECVCEDCK